MVPITREERGLKTFMAISAATYLVVGLTFAIAPRWILGRVNDLSRILMPSLEANPTSEGRFWAALAFSMMMTIATLAFAVWLNVRKNKGCVVPLLVSKCASSLSALLFFLLSKAYFSYLVIFLVDGALFVATFWFYIRANRAFFEAHTAFLRTRPKSPPSTGKATVAALEGPEKIALLDRVLEQSGFFEVLDERFRGSGKSKEAFAIVIKPNFMYMHSKKDISTYTDPELVEALVDRIAARGYANITLVEAQSTLGNYYRNREVLKVARYIGYSVDRNYRIVDLTEEKVPFDYGGRLGKHVVGPTWRDADFRVSFAKNKTHVFCHYTLTLKNIYGTLPEQNKLKEYHVRREYDWPTIETLKHFPVHFGLIDAVTSADGQFGVIVDPTPRHTRTIIGGANLIAVDWVGAKKMGLDPDDPKVGRFLPLAVEAFGRPEIECVGDLSVYEPWENVNDLLIRSLDLIEEVYEFSNTWFGGLTAMDEYFAFKVRAWPTRLIRILFKPLKRLVYRHDYLETARATRSES